MKFEIFQQLNTSLRKMQWYWHLKPAKGKAVAHSIIGYDTEEGCITAIALTKAAADAPVTNITTKKSVAVLPANPS